MALIHDIAESIIGDLTPDQAKDVNKHELEMVFSLLVLNVITLFKNGMKTLCSKLPEHTGLFFATFPYYLFNITHRCGDSFTLRRI